MHNQLVGQKVKSLKVDDLCTTITFDNGSILVAEAAGYEGTRLVVTLKFPQLIAMGNGTSDFLPDCEQ